MAPPSNNSAIAAPPGFSLDAQSGDNTSTPKPPEGFTLDQQPGLLSRVGSAVKDFVLDRATALSDQYKNEADTFGSVKRPLTSNDPKVVALRNQLGQAAMGVAAPGAALGSAADALGDVGKSIASNTRRILPGAASRQEATLSNVAKATGNFDPMGQAILQSTTGGEYPKLYDARASMLGRAAHVADENERRAAFRKIYTDPQFKRLGDFEQSPLGKKLTATTGKYSEVVKADPAKIPHAVFDTPESVRQFKNLLGGDQQKVEFYARQYAAESLNGIVQKAKNPEEVNFLKTQSGNVAKALRDWRISPQQEWLNEVPATKKAVDEFVGGFEDMAVAQKRFKIGVTALSAIGLGAGGELGISRMLPFRSLYGGAE